MVFDPEIAILHDFFTDRGSVGEFETYFFDVFFDLLGELGPDLFE